MRWVRRAAAVLALGVLLGAGGPLLDPSPPRAQANVACDVGLAPADAVTGALGIGNPAGDACDFVTDPVVGAAEDVVLEPIKEAASDIGKNVFNKITAWMAEGAVWLIGEVAVLTEKTTKPNLLSKGFVRQYRLMATIAAFLAALMLIFAVLEALGRGDPGMLGRVFFINLPLAAIATTAAYVVVQLLVATCDGMCQAITQSTGKEAEDFFQGTIEAIVTVGAGSGAKVGDAVGGAAGGPVGGAVGGAAGGVAGASVPMFVGFIALAIAAFAAFFVWIELLMRDAAIYIVALFLPFAIGAAIWPRWSTALRRTCELLIVIVFSKFVIVAIIALAASLLAHNNGSVEHVLAATVMLLLSCFAPFVLFKLIPFAEGAMSAAYGRQSATSGGVRAVEFANSMMMVQRLSRANWSAGGGGGPKASGGGGAGGTSGGSPKAGSGGGGAGGGAGAGAGAAGAGAVAIGATVGAAKAAKGAAERVSASGTAQSIEGGGDAGAAAPSGSTGSGAGSTRPAAGVSRPDAGDASPRSGAVGETAGSATPSPEPSEAGGGNAPTSGAHPPRPAADKGTSGAKGAKP